MAQIYQDEVNVFKPIHIVLENQEEVNKLAAIFNCAALLDVIERDLFTKKMLELTKYSKQDITSVLVNRITHELNHF